MESKKVKLFVNVALAIVIGSVFFAMGYSYGVSVEHARMKRPVYVKYEGVTSSVNLARVLDGEGIQYTKEQIEGVTKRLKAGEKRVRQN